MFSLPVSVNRSIPNHEIGIFSCRICVFLSWLFWLNSALKLKVLLQMANLHLYLFWEFLGKNDSNWDYWERSTLCQGTWHNTPAQLLRKAPCQKVVSGNWSADELQRLLKAVPYQQWAAMQEVIPAANFSTAEADMSRRDTIIPVLQGQLHHVEKLSWKKTYLLPFQ